MEKKAGNNALISENLRGKSMSWPIPAFNHPHPIPFAAGLMTEVIGLPIAPLRGNAKPNDIRCEVFTTPLGVNRHNRQKPFRAVATILPVD